jgi:hypothetical protein
VADLRLGTIHRTPGAPRGCGSVICAKRFHNHLQGQPGDGHVLGIDELTTLDQAAHQHARVLASQLASGDVVVLNDPQTAAMSVPLRGQARTSFGAVT